MRKILRVLLCLLLMLRHGAALAESGRLIVHECPADRWTVDAALTAPDAFPAETYLYSYVRQTADPAIRAMRQAMREESSPLLPLTADPYSPSLAYANQSPCGLTIPAEAACSPLSDAQRQLLDDVTAVLERASFHPCAQPYEVTPLQGILDAANAACLGRLQDWDTFARAVRNENDFDLSPETVCVVLTPAIDGCPIEPRLFGRHADSDVPMAAMLLLRHDRLVHMEVGCSYTVTGREPIGQPLIAWTDVVRRAIRSITDEWIPAWEQMSRYQAEGFDYPAFFAAFDPEFTLRISAVQGVYYATEDRLRPGWKVSYSIGIGLKNDEALPPEERHRYVWERYASSCIMDAVTGQRAE